MGIRRIKNEQGQPIEDLKPGADVHRAIGSLYEYGRSYPTGKRPHDYPSAKGIPHPKPATPSRNDYAGGYHSVRNSPVSPAPDESANQFRDAKVASHNDVPVQDWTRSGDHPFFDRGLSGARYSGVRHRK